MRRSLCRALASSSSRIGVYEPHQVAQGEDAHIAQAFDDRAGKPGFQAISRSRDDREDGLQVVQRPPSYSTVTCLQ